MTGLNREIKHKEFLKEIDLNLLAQLLDKLEIKEPNFYKAIKDNDLDLAVSEYEELEKKKNNRVVQLLKEINDFNSDEQMELLIELADRFEYPRNDKTALDLSMELYLYRPKEFDRLHSTLKEIYSKAYIAFKAEPKELDICEENLLDLQKDFSDQIQKEEFGKKIKIDCYSLSDRKILSYWLEDHTKNIKEFDDNLDIVNNQVRPIQEATLIYYPDSGTLQIKAKNDVLVKAIRRSFAKVCFKNKDLFEGEECRVCLDLSKLKTLYELPFDPAKVKEVKITGMKVNVKRGIPFTVELRTKGDIIKQLSLQGVQVKEDNKVEIIKVWIQFKFENPKLRQKTITLSTPNHIGIDNTEAGNLIRETISSWGLIN